MLLRLSCAAILTAGLIGLGAAALYAADAAPVVPPGAKPDADGSYRLTLDNLPAPVREQFLKQAGGNPIRGISMEMRNGKPTYDCDVFISGKKNEVIVDTEGKLLTPPLASAMPDKPAASAAAAAKPAAAPTFIHATLVKVDGKNLLVTVAAAKGAPAREMTVPTDDKTAFILDYEEGAKLADLKPGMTLTILPATGTAATVKAHVKGLYGKVVKVDGKSVVIMPAKAKKEVAVATDDATRVVIGGKVDKLANLKAGMEVKVIPPTGTAAKIAVVPPAAKAATKFRDTFKVDKAALADRGKGDYFILEPGCKLTYKSGIDTLVITVLDETKMVDGVRCRVVEERETKDGKLAEVSRNWFAIDKATGDVYYFGEAVDMYDADGKIVARGGSWESGKDGARFGLLLPGKPKVGDAYYQEVAPTIAQDRARVVSVTEEVKVPAGTFKNCLKTEESSAIEAGVGEKLYAPGIGLIKDDEFELAKVEMPL